MDYLWQVHFDYTWAGLLGNALRLAVVYVLLILGQQFLSRRSTAQTWQEVVERFLNYALLLFEPMAILLLVSYFILIQPFYHGLIFVLALLAGLQHFRNYWCGRILLFDPSLRIGTRLSYGQQRGLISYIGRIGIRLQTNKGLLFLNYSDLLDNGYTLLTGEESGSFFRLKIKADPKEDKLPNRAQLEELLQVIPYLNWQHQTQLELSQGQTGEWVVNLALHEEQHLRDLIERLAEQHFLASITKI